MGKRLLWIVVILLLSSGCSTHPEVQVVELRKNTVVYDEIVRINNCGGKGDSEQTVSREFAATVEFGAGISAGYQSIVQGNLSAKYSEYRNTSKSQHLVAPPGTNMEFVLRWSDDVRAGNVQVNGKSGTYEVRIPVSVEQISSRDLGCGSVVPIQPSVPTAQPALQATSEWIGKTPIASGYIHPSGVTISSGGTFSPSGDWIWICTGDFSVTRPDGSNYALYDSAEQTGLIVVLEQGSRVILNALWGGYCEPFAQSERSTGIAGKVSVMLSKGCGSRCISVNVKELDRNGNIVGDYWKP